MIKPYTLTLAVIAFFACGASASSTSATESPQTKYKQQVSDAISQFEQTDRQDWAFQISRYENEEGDVTSSLERFEPNADAYLRWHLLETNGEVPTAKQIKAFRDKKQKQAEDKKQGANFSIALRELINEDSLTFASETPSHFYMNFDVYIERLGEDAVGKLSGRLLFNKSQQFIELITIENNAEFSPMFGSSITELKLSFSFIKIEQSVLPQQRDMQMKGSFAFFTEIDEVSSDKFSDYRNVK